jgi:hypothetical protein
MIDLLHQLRHAFLAILLLTASGAQAAGTLGPLNDTGQTLCDNGTSTGTMVACTIGNTGDTSALPRQDGRFGRDPAAATSNLVKVGSGGVAGFDFTRVCFNSAQEGTSTGADTCTGVLAANNSATQTATPGTDWACTKDNVTNLIWSLQSGNAGDWSPYGTITLPNEHNVANGGKGRCGFNSGWRMPTLRELLSIVHQGLSVGPMIDLNYFPGTLTTAYYTSETYLPYTSSAWSINFRWGDSYLAFKSPTAGGLGYTYPVRLVRSLP